MENGAEAKMALKKELAFQHLQLEKEMRESDDDIQMALDIWRMRSKELKELEDAINFKEASRTAKLVPSGRKTAIQLLCYGRKYNPESVEEAEKLLIDCDEMDDKFRGCLSGDEKCYATFQARLAKED